MSNVRLATTVQKAAFLSLTLKTPELLKADNIKTLYMRSVHIISYFFQR